jgi:hypothetical protein
MSFTGFGSKSQRRAFVAVGIGLLGVTAVSWWYAYRSFVVGSAIVGVLAALCGLVLGLLGLLVLTLVAGFSR